MSATPSDSAKLAELIRDIRVAMLSTFSASGKPHTRPMYTQPVDPEKFDGTIWFMTQTDSGKVHEVEGNSDVLVTYSDSGKNRFVVLNGTARAEKNPEKARELWNIHAKGWFPDGPDDPTLTLLKVQVESGEYWDGPSKISYLLSLAKAVVTGQRVQTTGDHGKV